MTLILKRDIDKTWHVIEINNETSKEKVLLKSITKYTDAYKKFLNLCIKENIKKIDTYGTYLKGEN